MSIKAVVFDFGNVISMPQDTNAIEKLAEKIGVKREIFEPLLWSLRSEFDRGTICARTYYKNILSRFDISMNDEAIDEMIQMDLMSWKSINLETVTLMEEIKKAGLLLGILSNIPSEFLTWAKKNIPVFSLPDIGLFSCEVNLIKPEEAIYRKLLSLLGVQGSETVFFDDIEKNIEAARALGINAFLWKDPQKARLELSSLGLFLPRTTTNHHEHFASTTL